MSFRVGIKTQRKFSEIHPNPLKNLGTNLILAERLELFVSGELFEIHGMYLM